MGYNDGIINGYDSKISNSGIIGGFDFPLFTSGDSTSPDNTNFNSDGTVTISTTLNINTMKSNGRAYADGAIFNVTSLLSNCAIVTPAPSGALAPGDQILLINLQGTSSAVANVGNWELLTVASVQNNLIQFSTNKTKSYGDTAGSDSNIGTTTSNQRVIVQRVPHYANLTIASSGVLTCNSWATPNGGVLAFSADVLTVNGRITASTLGYAGGTVAEGSGGNGHQGESYDGNPQTDSRSARCGAGGGGKDSAGDGGGGGAYGTDGGNGGTYNGVTAIGGTHYGAADLSKVFIGSGAGGGSHRSNYVGGKGGGIIMIWCNTFTMGDSSSQIDSTGATGQIALNGYEGSAGSGAGGSILLVVSGTATFTGGYLRATGGPRRTCSADYQSGGAGGNGRIALKYGTLVGSILTDIGYSQAA